MHDELTNEVILELAEAADILGERARNFTLDRTNVVKGRAFVDALIDLQAAERKFVGIFEAHQAAQKKH